MGTEELAQLEVGDVLVHKPTGFTFVAYNTAESRPQVMTSITIECAEEWGVVKRRNGE